MQARIYWIPSIFRCLSLAVHQPCGLRMAFAAVLVRAGVVQAGNADN